MAKFEMNIKSEIGRLKEVMNVKSVLTTVLISIGILLVISSWATITEGQEGYFNWTLGEKPPSERELRLLSMDIPQSMDLSADVEHWAAIKFEADSKPEIRRVCFNFSGDRQVCVDVEAKDIRYGSHPYVRVPIHVPEGSKKIDCYAEYIREGKTRRTNTVTYYVIVQKKPESNGGGK